VAATLTIGELKLEHAPMVVEICVAVSDGLGCVKSLFYLNKMGALQHSLALQLEKFAKNNLW
jgi:hypothetical protein